VQLKSFEVYKSFKQKGALLEQVMGDEQQE
jgi:hypothetical protein